MFRDGRKTRKASKNTRFIVRLLALVIPTYIYDFWSKLHQLCKKKNIFNSVLENVILKINQMSRAYLTNDSNRKNNDVIKELSILSVYVK